MNKFTIGIITVILCLGLTPHVFAIDIPLNYVKLTEETNTLYAVESGAMGLSTRNLPSDVKLPEFNAVSPKYVYARFGDSKIILAFDRKTPDDPYFSRLYVDTDNDHDLTDEKALDSLAMWQESERNVTLSFPAVDVEIDIGNRTHPYRFQPQLLMLTPGYGQPGLDCLGRLRTACAYVGEFKFQDQTYRIAIGDGGRKGRFGEYHKVLSTRLVGGGVFAAEGDYLYITENGPFDYYERLALGQWLVIEDHLFEVSVDMDAQKMRLTPVTENLAKLKIATQLHGMTLVSKEGGAFVMAYGPHRSISIPVGSYSLFSYVTYKNDSEGDLWRLNARGTTTAPRVDVDERYDPVLRLGEPYTANIKLRQYGKQTPALIGFTVKGEAGEIVGEVRRIRGNATKIELSRVSRYSNRPAEPTYRITKSDGEIVASGSFEYG